MCTMYITRIKNFFFLLSLYHSIRNSYREPSNLLINKQTIFFQEATTQGDPLAMSMYGIAIITLIELLDDCFTVQKWYADNGNVVGSLINLKKRFDSMKKHGPVSVTILPNAKSLQKNTFLKKHS